MIYAGCPRSFEQPHAKSRRLAVTVCEKVTVMFSYSGVRMCHIYLLLVKLNDFCSVNIYGHIDSLTLCTKLLRKLAKQFQCEQNLMGMGIRLILSHLPLQSGSVL
jgi:hypothetical protein